MIPACPLSLVSVNFPASTRDVVLTSEESTEASAIYSDIITHVATSALQFINGAQDVDDDAVWNSYVKSIEDMNIDDLTEIIQTAYDRVN